MPKGAHKNTFTILGVEATGRKGLKSQEYLDIPSLCTSSRTGCIGVKNSPLFLSQPKRGRRYDKFYIKINIRAMAR
jgi:hypothetical protein